MIFRIIKLNFEIFHQILLMFLVNFDEKIEIPLIEMKKNFQIEIQPKAPAKLSFFLHSPQNCKLRRGEEEKLKNSFS